jgi:hypothetical protein
MTKKTYHEGAEAERKAFRANLRRDLRNASEISVRAYIEGKLKWVQGRCDRYKKIAGGL